MIYKKYIDAHTVEDVPKNGIIRIEFENEEGEKVITTTAVSNIPLAFENDEKLANLNGYYRYEEEDYPVFNDMTHYVEDEYVLEDNVITKKWVLHQVEEVITEEVVIND